MAAFVWMVGGWLWTGESLEPLDHDPVELLFVSMGVALRGVLLGWIGTRFIDTFVKSTGQGQATYRQSDCSPPGK